MNVGLIVAAGQSRRFDPGEKQFIILAGRPLLAYAVEAFCAAGLVDEIVVVTREQDVQRCRDDVVARYGAAKPVTVVPGGAERTLSVAAGLAVCPGGTELVWVHDGARPLVTGELIDAMVPAIDGYDGVILAAPVTDTIKVVESGVILKTPAREYLWRAQTPQLFHYSRLKAAVDEALANGYMATDEAAAVERAGGRVAVFPNETDNLKVTTEADLRLAELLLERRTRS